MYSARLWKISRTLFPFLVLISTFLLITQPVQSATLIVTNTSDSGAGSLRQAIIDANSAPGPHTIEFNIPGCSGTCVIQPDTKLPALTSGDTTIDGYTQDGAAPATASSFATLKIELDGRYIIAWNGLDINSSNNVIRGLSIHRFQGNAIWINGTSATGNVVEGNYLGLDADLVFYLGNGFNGVLINLGAQNNSVGGDTPASRNVIAKNGLSGVEIHGSGASGNVISGNYIGAHPDGAGASENFMHGVRIYGGAHDNIIGGDSAGERNLLSGNTLDGVRIEGPGSDNNLVMGNYIGVDVSGIGTVENGENGVRIINGAKNNTIGGDTSAKGNVISANMAAGVRINDSGTQGNVIAHNLIGLGSDGSWDLGNDGDGIYLYESSGDTVIGPGNVISGNQNKGIWIDGVNGTQVFGNYIGTNASGNAIRMNDSDGIMVGNGSANTLIGGHSSAARNIIAGNDSYGIKLADNGTDNITIAGNYIGLGANGSLVLGNNGGGVEISNGVQNVTIGGDSAGERNLVSGNGGYGIVARGTETQGFVISGNYVGTDTSGLLDRGNAYTGVHVYSGAHNVLVGGDTPGERNVISGNDECGIDLWASINTVDDVTVSGNYIGLGADGVTPLGNSEHGIIVSQNITNLTIGGDTVTKRNIISANGYHGIYLHGSDVTQNTVMGNYIGTDSSGFLDLGNSQDGIRISDSAHDNTIGPDNLITNNSWDGVRVDTPLASGNQITENSIFSNGLAGINLTNGANNAIQPPIVDDATFNPYQVTGTACPGCLVEVFQNTDGDGEGQHFLGAVTAHVATGNFSLTAPFMNPYLTATATDSGDGTSEFSAVFEAPFQTVVVPLTFR